MNKSKGTQDTTGDVAKEIKIEKEPNQENKSLVNKRPDSIGVKPKEEIR